MNYNIEYLKCWAVYIRMRYRTGMLSQKQVALLKKYDFDFVGNVAPQWMVFLPYEEAREYVHKLKLKTYSEWCEYRASGNKPSNIPSNPVSKYRKEWIDWADWLGSDNRKVGFLPFEKARELVRELKLTSKNDYTPKVIPPLVASIGHYKKQGKWLSWGDWLGTTPGWDGKFLSFEEARKVVHSLGLKSVGEWNEYCNRTDRDFRIPKKPQHYYKKEWIGWVDWFGIEKEIQIKKQKVEKEKLHSLEELKKIAKKNNIHSRTEWVSFASSHNLPKRPQRIYSKCGWNGWYDFCGITESESRQYQVKKAWETKRK